MADSLQAVCVISIHAPREGGDVSDSGTAFSKGGFQSTPPARGATLKTALLPDCVQISIHAPREGGDHGIPRTSWSPSYFNPRPPRGGRQQDVMGFAPSAQISIHAPREGGDSKDAQFYLRIFDK